MRTCRPTLRRVGMRVRDVAERVGQAGYESVVVAEKELRLAEKSAASTTTLGMHKTMDIK
jgi:hypothetical protein